MVVRGRFRRSHSKPSNLKAGKFYDVSVELNELAQIVPTGHRLRVAVSTSYWPMLWPSPQAATLTVDAAASSLELPVLARESGLEQVEFEPVSQASPLKLTVEREGAETRELVTDIESQRTSFVVTRDDGNYRIDDIGTNMAYTKEKIFSVIRDDPLSAESSVACTMHYRRDDWDAKVETETFLHSDLKYFYLTATVRAFEKGKRFFEREFEHRVKRDHL